MASIGWHQMVMVFMVLAIGKSETQLNYSCVPGCEQNYRMLEAYIYDIQLELLDYKARLEEMEREPLHSDCSALLKTYSLLPSGIYKIQLPEGKKMDVYCDMTTDGGGWLVFQRRQDGSENFYRNWTNYKNGFGSLDGEFWLGNDVLASITNQRSYELRVDMEYFKGTKVYQSYSVFSTAGEEDKYRLSVSIWSAGTAGDALSHYNRQQFSTFDNDNDKETSVNCAKEHKGAWWYGFCSHPSLNGQYFDKIDPLEEKGAMWFNAEDHNSFVKFSEMKIRPK